MASTIRTTVRRIACRAIRRIISYAMLISRGRNSLQLVLYSVSAPNKKILAESLQHIRFGIRFAGLGDKMMPERNQNGVKMKRNGIQLGPESPPAGQKEAQEPLRGPQGGSKKPQYGSKRPQNSTRGPQERSERLQDDPKKELRWLHKVQMGGQNRS